MKIEIKYEEVEQKKKTIVSVGKQRIIVAKDISDNWNTQKINEFLINIANNAGDEERFEVIYDKEQTDEVYKYVCKLFEAFANEYNNLLSLDNTIL